MEFHREQDLLDHLTTQPPSGVVTVDGFDGAGKTTLAQKISRNFNLPSLDIDSILLGPKGPSYLDRIDYERLTAEISARKTGLVISGVCIQRIFSKIVIMPSIKIYVKLISSNGLWHQGSNIDSEYFDENEELGGGLRRYSPLTVDILRYHREFMPHINSDLFYTRVDE